MYPLLTNIQHTPNSTQKWNYEIWKANFKMLLFHPVSCWPCCCCRCHFELESVCVDDRFHARRLWTNIRVICSMDIGLLTVPTGFGVFLLTLPWMYSIQHYVIPFFSRILDLPSHCNLSLFASNWTLHIHSGLMYLFASSIKVRVMTSARYAWLCLWLTDAALRAEVVAGMTSTADLNLPAPNSCYSVTCGASAECKSMP